MKADRRLYKAEEERPAERGKPKGEEKTKQDLIRPIKAPEPAERKEDERTLKWRWASWDEGWASEDGLEIYTKSGEKVQRDRQKLKKITHSGVSFLQVRSEVICREFRGRQETEQKARCRWWRLERVTHRLTNKTKAFAGTIEIRNKLSEAPATRLPEFPWQFWEERAVCMLMLEQQDGGPKSLACRWKNYSN